MRVLHAYKVYKPDVEGGIPEAIASLAQDAPTNFESLVVTCRSRGLGARYVHNGVPVVASSSLGAIASLPIAPFYLPTFLREARRADVIVNHAPFPLTDVAMLALHSRAALVVHWHAEIVGREAAMKGMSFAIRRCLARADKIIVSHPVIVTVSKFLAPHFQKCVVIPYGVDTKYWGTLTVAEEKSAALLRQRWPNLIVSVGRLVGYKGFDVLLRALQNVNAQLVIIGEGPLREELIRLSWELGVANKVNFASRLPKDEVKTYLHAAKCLVLASTSIAESFGIVQAEALAAGCPVINTDLPTAVPYVARDGREGLTVQAGNSLELERALQMILRDDGLRRRLAQNSMRRARKSFDIIQFRDRNYGIYEEAASRVRRVS